MEKETLEKGIFNRAQLLMGDDFMARLHSCRVIVFGVGGVGSWCVEGLVRSGFRHITIVDSDCVSISNVNRQLMATTETVGRVKVEALRDHLLTLNPSADITCIQDIYCESTHEQFALHTYDYIIDCIDSLEHKALLIRRACETDAVFFSSMGAALKLDPTRIHVAEFWKVQGCPLARALRQRFKRQKLFPRHKFQCVYSDELLPNRGHDNGLEAMLNAAMSHGVKDGKEELRSHDWTDSKAQVNGSLCHITAIFGLTIAGLVMKDVESRLRD